MSAQKQVKALVIGGGNRGQNYAKFSLDFPERLKIVGVAEPRRFQRDRIQNEYRIAKENIFSDWKDAVQQDKFADCVFICTPDRFHKEPAVAFAKKGYHVLLEKPMAVTYEDCQEIVKTTKENGVLLAVCHVLRYAPQAIKIKEVIESGVIGDVVNIQLLEPVGCWHFAHSFVRGNWNSSETSTFSLLSKSCHDLDLIQFWMGSNRCVQISSFGSLKHFNSRNKPEGAASRCVECKVEETCPYSAKKIYLDRCVKSGHTGWPVKVITDVPDIESVTEALTTGPYGRCVYDCDNDVCDNQVVNLQFEGGATASFTMVAFTEKICARQTRVFGTKGELSCDFDYLKVDRYDFLSGERDYYDVREKTSGKSRLRGHGGADFHAMDAFISAVADNNPSKILTGPDETLESHRLCFLAEEARLQNKVVQL